MDHAIRTIHGNHIQCRWGKTIVNRGIPTVKFIKLLLCANLTKKIHKFKPKNMAHFKNKFMKENRSIWESEKASWKGSPQRAKMESIVAKKWSIEWSKGATLGELCYSDFTSPWPWLPDWSCLSINREKKNLKMFPKNHNNDSNKRLIAEFYMDK